MSTNTDRVKLYRAMMPQHGKSAYIAEVDAKLTAHGYELDPDRKLQPHEWGHRTFIGGRIAKNNGMFIAFSAVDAAYMAMRHFEKARNKAKEEMIDCDRLVTDFAALGLAASGITVKDASDD